MKRYDELYALICDRGITDGFGPRGQGHDIQQNPAELASFLVEMQRLGVQTVLELGTGPHGGLARFLVEVMGWRVISVDVVRPLPIPTWEFIKSRTEDAYPQLSNHRFDLVIIDADHTYLAVKRDYDLYARLGSIVMLHDIAPGRLCCEGSARHWSEIAYVTGTLKSGYHEHIADVSPVGIGWFQREAIRPRAERKVAAIVSVYNNRQFLRGHLDDLLSQTIANQLEIICVNSGSKHPEDAAVLAEYSQAHEQVRVIETKRDPIYVSWNIGIKAARAPYITNSNADDRHAPWALEKLAEALDAGGDLAFPNVYCTKTPNAVWNGDWELWLDDPVNYPGGIVPWANYPFSPKRLWDFCHIGPIPMWRKSLHDEIGYFDVSFSIAGDYEWWMRAVAHGAKIVPVPLYLGLFYFDATHNLSQSSHDQLIYENRRIRQRYKELANYE